MILFAVFIPKDSAKRFGAEKSNGQRPRLLAGVTRQASGVAVHTQFLGTAGAELVLRQHADDGFADDPFGLGFTYPLGWDFL